LFGRKFKLIIHEYPLIPKAMYPFAKENRHFVVSIFLIILSIQVNSQDRNLQKGNVYVPEVAASSIIQQDLARQKIIQDKKTFTQAQKKLSTDLLQLVHTEFF